jgi:hypothetical protein
MTPLASIFYGMRCSDIMERNPYYLSKLGLCLRRIADHVFDPTLKDVIIQHPRAETKDIIHSKIPQMEQILQTIMVIFSEMAVTGADAYGEQLQALLREKMRDSLKQASK